MLASLESAVKKLQGADEPAAALMLELTFPSWTARPAFWIRRMADMAALSSPLS
jgi:hypothetical protein